MVTGVSPSGLADEITARLDFRRRRGNSGFGLIENCYRVLSSLVRSRCIVLSFGASLP